MRFWEVAFVLSVIGFCWFGWVWFLFVWVFFFNKLSPFVFWSLDFSTATLLSSLIPGDL